MESYLFFLGTDISKVHLDYRIRDAVSILDEFRVANTPKGIREAVRRLCRIEGFTPGRCLVCLEHTGVYGEFVLATLHGMGFAVWLEVATCIKNGTGTLARGKSDKVDAARIADYAFTFRAKARLWEPPRKELVLLADLMALRSRMLGASAKLRVPLDEIRHFKASAHYQVIRQAAAKTAASLKKDIKALDMKVKQVIAADPELARLYRIITSVRGVGFVSAVMFVITTKEFSAISDPRKLACHAGCAPFEHSSGSSIRGRSRVSHRADKRLKSLLHMCALSVIRVPGEMKDYFDRQVAAGKNKFIVLNAIRNKIIHRVCACVRDNREYTDLYVRA